MEAVMNKVVASLALFVLLAGCQPMPSKEALTSPVPGYLCMTYFDYAYISPEQVTDIVYLSKSDNACKMVLGKMYERGHGVPQDIAKAKDLYQTVARVSPIAYSRLGVLAEEGIGGPVDLVAARDFYQRATKDPSTPDIELKLAGLMENGKGGPQDLQGALKHYFNASKTGSTEAWKGLERLRSKGVVMTTEEQQAYNNLFVGLVQRGLRKHMEATEKTLEKVTTPTQPGKPVQVQLEYTPGTLVPTLSIYASSGDSVIDQKVMQGFSDYRFPGDPIMPQGQKNYLAVAYVRTDGMTPMERFYQDRKKTQ